MRRFAVLVSLVTVAAVGCGSTEQGPEVAPSNPDAPTSSQPGATQPPASDNPTTTASPDDSTTSSSGRQPAPDFTLALGEGGEYSLSAEAKPVYLVFWAEW